MVVRQYSGVRGQYLEVRGQSGVRV